MSNCCGNSNSKAKTPDPCSTPASACCSESQPSNEKAGVLSWFSNMVPNALKYVKEQKSKGRKIAGILCEYTPRELIIAAGGVPVCLCGGSAKTILSAEKHLPANLCPLIKSTYGYSLENSNPFLDMIDLIIAETTCDGKKKMFELLSDIHPMHVLELPQKPNDKDAMLHWISELKKLKSVLESRFCTNISNTALEQAIKLMNKERRLRRNLAELMKGDNPPLTGRELLDLKSIVSAIPCDFIKYQEAINQLQGVSIDPPASKRMRTLLTGVPLPHGAERVLEIIEEKGGLVVAQENCTGIKPIYEDIEEDTGNPLYAIAEKYFHLPCSVMTPNNSRMDLIKKLAAEYKAECVIELVWQACITYDVESRLVKKWVEEKLNLPYLRIETDYSPSDSARIGMRIEALFETIKSKKGCL